MKLTRIQLKFLKTYERFHTGSVTVSGFVRTCLLSWLVLLVAAPLGFMATTAVGVPAAGWFVVGMCVGAFFRDIGRFQILFRTWPVVREITRWERVGELIRTNENMA